MPSYQNPKAERLAAEAEGLRLKAATASGPEKARLEAEANAKLHEADEIEGRSLSTPQAL